MMKSTSHRLLCNWAAYMLSEIGKNCALKSGTPSLATEGSYMLWYSIVRTKVESAKNTYVLEHVSVLVYIQESLQTSKK